MTIAVDMGRKATKTKQKNGAVKYQESGPMASGCCAGMSSVVLSRNVDEVIDDSVHHDCFTLLTAML